MRKPIRIEQSLLLRLGSTTLDFISKLAPFDVVDGTAMMFIITIIINHRTIISIVIRNFSFKITIINIIWYYMEFQSCLIFRIWKLWNRRSLELLAMASHSKYICRLFHFFQYILFTFLRWSIGDLFHWFLQFILQITYWLHILMKLSMFHSFWIT